MQKTLERRGAKTERRKKRKNSNGQYMVQDPHQMYNILYSLCQIVSSQSPRIIVIVYTFPKMLESIGAQKCISV